MKQVAKLTAPALVAGLLALTVSTSRGESSVQFNRDILPILADCCLDCHGFDKNKRQGALRLDLAEDALRDHDGTTPIVPGKPDESEVIRRITSRDPGERMPPSDANKRRPTSDEIEKLRRWISEGAKYERHWAFLPPRKPSRPEVHHPEWVRNEIDSFVLEGLERNGMLPAAEASKETLIRRVTLDLTGLPPTLAELKTFLADHSADAYEKVVDRLFASAHYGEQMAQPWLDLARYADTDGFEHDEVRQIWPYRDWVIKALNDDMPFDQFTIEQLAGDLLPNVSENQILATGFHRNTPLNREQGIDIAQWWYATLVDRVSTTGATWLGMTIGCAQCHDHKYDPIKQQDFYRLMAIFNQDASELKPETRDNDSSYRQDISPKLESTGPLVSQGAKVASPVMRRASKSRETFVHIRGNYLTPGEKVEPELPLWFGTHNSAVADRMILAKWLVSNENPLPARVVVNRIWQQHFGHGIVETLEDFGTRGALPSNPALLDWLSSEFKEHGWSQKHIHKLIVTSATYRQSSQRNAEKLQLDPRNRWLSYFPRQRLTAEQLRDNALAISGLLSLRVGGPPVFPYQPHDAKSAIYSGNWPTSSGEDRYRRAIYTFWRRTATYASFQTFDAPSRETCTAQRLPTNTALQALDLLNDTVYIEAARGLARRLMNGAGDALDDRISLGMRLCVARFPTQPELQSLREFYTQTRENYVRDPAGAKELLGDDDRKASDYAAFVILANVLLNLDETICKP